MGYGFMVWAVDTAKLAAVAGSKDEKLRRMIGGRFKRDLASLDDLFEHDIAAGRPNTYEALRQIIDGAIPEGAQGGIYYYAFKLIVEHFGKPLDNSMVYPWNSPEFDLIDKALADMNVPFQMSRLHGLGLPVKLPYPDDFPMTGWIDAARVKAIDEAFAKAPEIEADSETRDILRCARLVPRGSSPESRPRGLLPLTLTTGTFHPLGCEGACDARGLRLADHR